MLIGVATIVSIGKIQNGRDMVLIQDILVKSQRRNYPLEINKYL